jgi:hypothetical protein
LRILVVDDEDLLSQKLEGPTIALDPSNPFSARVQASLKRTAECYGIVKDLALYAEELKDESFLPPINELRDAFDHLMRAYAVQFGLRSGDGKYIAENVDAAFRHVYRALFDYLDYIRIYQKDYIYKKLDGISHPTIVSLFPEYYREILPEIESCLEDIPRYRGSKDIGNPDLEMAGQYHAKVMKLKDYCAQIQKKAPALIEAENKRQLEEEEREKKKSDLRRGEHWKYLLFTIIGSVIGGIIIAVFT